jgi:hypothetical protein
VVLSQTIPNSLAPAPRAGIGTPPLLPLHAAHRGPSRHFPPVHHHAWEDTHLASSESGGSKDRNVLTDISGTPFVVERVGFREQAKERGDKERQCQIVQGLNGYNLQRGGQSLRSMGVVGYFLEKRLIEDPSS